MQVLLNQVSIAAAGFSVIALALLAFQDRSEQKVTNILSKTLLTVLMAIQGLQVLYLMDYLSFENSIAFIYLLLLGCVGPLFYIYSQHVIQTDKKWANRELIHFMPAVAFSLFGSIFPAYFNIAYSLLFLLGGVYMCLLVWSLYQLRERRSLFKMEFFFTTSFLSWAIAVVLVGLFSTQSMNIMIPAQIIMLAIAIAGAVHIQLKYPHLLGSLEEIANRQYQTTTLHNVDCEEVKQQLDTLMTINKVYQDTELSLSSMAEMLSLKSHQLSELINTQLGVSFSSYLRYKRVEAAGILLKTEPESSVLAIGLDVGFSSQSAFYSAFKEVYSMTLAQLE